MNDVEREIRNALGIADQYTSVLILEQSAHCDWDWLATFAQYYSPGGDNHQAVQETLTQAIQYIASGLASGPVYTYVFCEVAYLQSFMNDQNVTQALKDELKQFAGKHFFFASGGITSADNLLVHPEAFIRNYLLGRQWLQETFGATAANGAVSNQMWIPDDFGHDSQLPALLQAMGFTGAGFWRIPAQCGVYNNNCDNGDGTDEAPSVYLPEKVGLDFHWQANDGSRVQAHWLSESYCQGNNVLGGGSSIDTREIEWKHRIQDLIDENTTPVMPTPYMFTPIDCDFCIPYDNGPSIFDQWNAQEGETTFVVQATFDDYMKLVAAATENAGGTSRLQTLSAHPPAGSAVPPYIPNPYYMGCYASKPYLKIVHYETVRTLLMAESMQLLLPAIGETAIAEQALTELATAWNQLAPSTHHDYITGTAPNGPPCGEDVYRIDQVDMLDKAQASAEEVQGLVLKSIAAHGHDADATVMIFNSLGFERLTVAELAQTPAGGPYRSTYIDGRTFYPVQDDGQGGLLVLGNPPALGYTTVQLSTQPPNVPTGVSATKSGSSVTMTNGWLIAVIDGSGITSLRNTQGVNCFPGASGNRLRLFVDGGNIYRFGNEIPCIETDFYWDSDQLFQMTSISCHSGDLRATTIVEGTLGGHPFTIRYDLQDRDRALRISVTGAAPSGYDVMAYFEFASDPVSLTYGTTAHWDNQQPRDFFTWEPPATTELMTFEPTHDYVAVVNEAGEFAGAVYHSATPAWGIYNRGIIGCLLRNTPGNQNAACGTDFGTYTITYAVEPPDLLKPPGEGAGSESMLGVALNLNTPVVAVPVTGTGQLPASLSIAATADDRAIVTAAKAGTVDPSQLVLRLYQPTNDRIDHLTVDVADLVASGYRSGGVLAASAVDALEQPSTQVMNITTGPSSVTLDLPFAITTIALGSG